MRVMVDSNVLISAGVFRSQAMADVMRTIAKSHKLVLTNTIIAEVMTVVNVKFPLKANDFGGYFAELDFEYQYIPQETVANMPIRDEKDQHILASAKLAGVDILITGDNDFFEQNYDWVTVMRPAEFIQKFGK